MEIYSANNALECDVDIYELREVMVWQQLPGRQQQELALTPEAARQLIVNLERALKVLETGVNDMPNIPKN